VVIVYSVRCVNCHTMHIIKKLSDTDLFDESISDLSDTVKCMFNQIVWFRIIVFTLLFFPVNLVFTIYIITSLTYPTQNVIEICISNIIITLFGTIFYESIVNYDTLYVVKYYKRVIKTHMILIFIVFIVTNYHIISSIKLLLHALF